MLRLGRGGVTFFGEVLPIVLCDFYKLPLEGFDASGEICVIHPISLRLADPRRGLFLSAGL